MGTLGNEPTYINLMEKFLEEQLNELTPLEAVLYLNLFHIRNKARLENGKQMPEWFTVKNNKLSDTMGKETKGIRRLKQSLKAKGLIDYQQGKKGTPTKYRLLDGEEKGVKIRGENLPPKQEKGAKFPPHNDPQNVPLFEAQSLTAQGLADPPREEENKRIKRYKKQDKPFSHPSLEDVREYVQEKGLDIDPQRFVDYYEAGDWHDRYGKPVKNWKQRAQSWNRSNGRQEAPPPDAASFSLEEQEARQRAEDERQRLIMERIAKNGG